MAVAQSEPCQTVLFASRLDNDCSLGAELLCTVAPEIAKHYPELQITVAGGGNACKRIALLAEKANRAIGFECITVCGTCHDMAKLMRAHTVFVGVSRAALEATACGCAVILCGNEGYLGILNEDRYSYAALTNFCCRGEKEATADQLKQDLLTLLASPALCRQYAQACRTRLLGEHTAQTVCDQTLALYQRAKHQKPALFVTVGGYFGCKNLGDDAILQAFLMQMRALAPDICVQALVGTPRRCRLRFLVPCFHRKNPFAILFACLRSRACLCGGGSLLQNSTGGLSLLYYNTLLRVFARFGGASILYAAGIGPLYGKRASKHTWRILRRCRYISLRDPDSMKLLDEAGIDRALLHLGADPALLLPPPSLSRSDAILASLGIAPEQKFICTVLRTCQHPEEIDGVAVATTRMLCKRYGWHALFVCLCPEDRRMHEKAAQRLGGSLLIPTEPSDVSAVLRRAELLLSMRLHAMILAATVACPFVGLPIANDQKIPSFARMCAQEWLSPDELSVGALVEVCERIYHSAPAFRPIFCNAVAEMQKNAKKDLANIVAMVYNINRYVKKSEEKT